MQNKLDSRTINTLKGAKGVKNGQRRGVGHVLMVYLRPTVSPVATGGRSIRFAFFPFGKSTLHVLCMDGGAYIAFVQISLRVVDLRVAARRENDHESKWR